MKKQNKTANQTREAQGKEASPPFPPMSWKEGRAGAGQSLGRAGPRKHAHPAADPNVVKPHVGTEGHPWPRGAADDGPAEGSAAPVRASSSGKGLSEAHGHDSHRRSILLSASLETPERPNTETLLGVPGGLGCSQSSGSLPPSPRCGDRPVPSPGSPQGSAPAPEPPSLCPSLPSSTRGGSRSSLGGWGQGQGPVRGWTRPNPTEAPRPGARARDPKETGGRAHN